MGSCAAPSAKGDDKFITTDYLQQCPQGDKVLMPLAIQVHHAVCDGFHVGRMLNELQQYCDEWQGGA
ncbi:hypothetical protein DMB35_06105 [Acinetobacter baumannii A424]|nr:hypothetical protein DMB35_06105 [Acinetobacter baumannii A424]